MKNSLMAAGVLAAPSAIGRTPMKQSTEKTKGENELFFEISLAQWSLNKRIFGGQLDNLDFPAYTKEKFGIEAVEYVNQFFKSADKSYISELKKRSDDQDVRNVLIMIDREGNLGDSNENARAKAVENHYKWVEAAELLGCHSIRVNAGGQGSPEEVAHNATRSLRKLSQFAADYNISVIVENHGGYSSRGSWLSSVIRNTGMINCGTLPDFGNFNVSKTEKYDIYLGMEDLMPLAKGVSAKSHDFDADGNESTIDYYRIMQTVKDAGYRSYVGIEYEGRRLSEDEGIIATRDLLIKAGKSMKA